MKTVKTICKRRYLLSSFLVAENWPFEKTENLCRLPTPQRFLIPSVFVYCIYFSISSDNAYQYGNRRKFLSVPTSLSND
jgi:hypothetical protein